MNLEVIAKRKRSWRSLAISKKLKKRLVRSSILTVNLLVLLAVFAFVVHHNTSQAITTSQLPTSDRTSVASADPLDQLSSVNIAVQVARMTGIYESTSVTNLADSEDAQQNIVAADSQLIAKPQVVSTALKSNQDIVKYITKQGDTLSSLAVKFGVTSNSIIGSNNLTAETITPGQSLLIPPINGIVYTVKNGDTAANLAATYNANASQIISFNNDEISGLVSGQLIVIPNGVPPSSSAASSYGYGYAFGYGPIYGYNGYDFGTCTWYVASQISVPSNWGNADTWSYYASLSGWTVTSGPQVGSIAQTPYGGGGDGHVALVIGVNGNQVEVKDMNNWGDGGGFDRVGQEWVPISTFPNYIYH